MKKIMIIDDDVYIGNMLEETLEKRGFGDCIEAVWGIGRKIDGAGACNFTKSHRDYGRQHFRRLPRRQARNIALFSFSGKITVDYSFCL